MLFLYTPLDLYTTFVYNVNVVKKGDEALPMTPREMVKFLKKNGFIEKGQRGSHKKMFNPDTKKITIVPMHNKDLGNGLEASIKKQAGLK
nr:type II toxin-antitoxin system HicA family toxin [Lactococcus sp. UBA7220]